MTRPAADTECLELAYALEDSNGVPGTFKKILPSDISRLGKSNELTPPDVIDGTRQRRTGKITRSDAGADYTGPVSMSSAGDFLYAAMYRNPSSVDRNIVVDVEVSAKTNSGYTLRFGSNADATKAGPLLPINAILFINGHDDPANDGYKFVTRAGVVSTNTVQVNTTLASGAVSDVSNLRASIAGVLMPAATITSWVTAKNATTGEITGSLTFNQASDAQAFTDTHKLVKDQPVHFGHYIDGDITDTFQANDVGFGYAVFDSRNGAVLNFKEVAPTLEVASQITTSRNVSMMFADYVTNTKGCNDPDFMEHQFTVQEFVPGEGTGQDARPASYTYVTGAEVNTLGFDFSDGALARMSVAMVGRDAEQTSTVKTGGDSVEDGAYPDVMNSSADFARIGIKSRSGADRGTSVDSISFNINNNVTQRTRAGKLAAFKLTKGQLQVDVSITALFTHPEILDDIYKSVPGSVRLIQYCFDGALYFYAPNTVYGNGARTRTRQDSMTVTIDGQANAASNSQGGYSIGIGRFFGDFRTAEDF